MPLLKPTCPFRIATESRSETADVGNGHSEVPAGGQRKSPCVQVWLWGPPFCRGFPHGADEAGSPRVQPVLIPRVWLPSAMCVDAVGAHDDRLPAEIGRQNPQFATGRGDRSDHDPVAVRCVARLREPQVRGVFVSQLLKPPVPSG